MWNIRIEFETVVKTLFVAEGDLDFFAKTLSLGTGKRVSISAMARIRRVYQHGKVVADQPSLRHFYSDISDTQEWAWKAMNFLLKDVPE